MRPFLLLLVGLLLAGVGQGAFAASYRWSVIGIPGTLMTESGGCAGVAEAVGKYYERLGMSPANGYTPTVGPVLLWWGTGVCSFRTLNEVGAQGSVQSGWSVGTSGGVVTNTVSLVGLDEDDVLSDVSSVPLQRVLVMIGCGLMFGLGIVAGKT